MISHVLLLCLILSTLALYQGNSPVKLLNDETFQKMLKSKSMWLVEFFSPQCGHCVQAAPEFEKAAGIAEGVVNFAAVDMTKYPSLGGSYGIRGYPTFKFFGGNKQSPVDYNGQRSAQDFVQFTLTQTKNVITQRANGGKSKQKQSQQGDGSKSKKGKIIQLTDATFKDKVLNSEQAWFIDFYSPSCGHCKNLEPEFNKLPDLMKGKLKIAKIDASVHRQIASAYNVQGFPTLIFFPTGKKELTSTTQKYEGQRTAEDMAAWLNSQKIGPAKAQLLELSKTSYNSECQKNNACLLILIQNDGQLKNIKFLKDLMQKNSQLPIKYFFTKQKLNTLQSDLMIDDRSYPKILSILPSRNSYKMYNKPIEQEPFQNYIKNMFTTNWIKFNSKVENYLFPNTEL